MKEKTSPHQVVSGSPMEIALYEGLNKKQKKYAKEKVAYFKELGVSIPWGMIRKSSLKI